MSTSRIRFPTCCASPAYVSGAIKCSWQRYLADGIIMSVNLTRLMSAAEGCNTNVPAGDSETVAVVSL